MRASDKCLLILSSLFEPNVNHPIRRLEERGVRWWRFNTETFPLLCQRRIEFFGYGRPFGSEPRRAVGLDRAVDSHADHRSAGRIIVALAKVESSEFTSRLESSLARLMSQGFAHGFA